jgi:hypothetical protein
MKLPFCIVLLIAFACAVPAEARLSTCKGAKRCTSHVQCDVCANELFCSSGKCTSTLNEAGGTTRYRSRHTRFGAGKDAGDRGEPGRIKNNALMRTAKKLKKRTLRKRRAQRKRHFNLPQYRVRVIEQCPPQLACLVTCSSCTSHLHSFGVGLTLVSLAFEVPLQSSPARWLAAAHSALKEKNGSLRARMQYRLPVLDLLTKFWSRCLIRLRVKCAPQQFNRCQQLSRSKPRCHGVSAQEAPARSPGAGSATNGQAQGARLWAPEAGGAAKPEETTEGRGLHCARGFNVSSPPQPP